MPDHTMKNCFLCGILSELQDSHFLPKHIYARMNMMINESDRHTPMILTNENVSRPISRQISEYYFCKNCEQRLRKKGEDYFSRNGIPKMDPSKPEKPNLINAIQSFVPSCDNSRTSYLPNKGNISLIEENQLLYFAISLFWRASLTWRNFISINYSKNILDEMKLFLLGKKNTIETFKILVDIPYDKTMFSVILPTELKYSDGKKEYLMNILYYSFKLIPTTKESNEPTIFYGINKANQDLLFKLFNYKYDQRIEKGNRPHFISWN